MQTAKFAKKIAGFIVCYILAFMISRYGMPLYPITSWLVDHSYQYFSHYQSDTYEAGTDPITFTTLLVVIFIWALILYSLLRWLLKKIWR
ncbi:Uncharacterised protein [Enterobacter hormaechei]|nr:Uncharacterised protein [Enterobacter hormaechei]SAG82087.1 Uncharacterised protein [Enterobacter hormaechei]SAH81829.1 Uncharacterised protein [Enterobacter hormaechei]